MSDLVQSNRIETTVGELIEAITQTALESGQTKAEGYTLASLTIERILEGKQQRLNALLVQPEA